MVPRGALTGLAVIPISVRLYDRSSPISAAYGLPVTFRAYVDRRTAGPSGTSADRFRAIHNAGTDVPNGRWSNFPYRMYAKYAARTYQLNDSGQTGSLSTDVGYCDEQNRVP
jgi:hypothetical protein